MASIFSVFKFFAKNEKFQAIFAKNEKKSTQQFGLSNIIINKQTPRYITYKNTKQFLISNIPILKKMKILVENPIKITQINEKKAKFIFFFILVGAIVLGPKVLPKIWLQADILVSIPNTKFVLYSLALNHSIFLHSLTL